MRITLEWLGTATFRLTIDDAVCFLDAYMDRVASAPPVGLSARDVTKATAVLVGHSHFDHLAGSDVIAANTGARVIGSNETCRVLRERGVPDAQLLTSVGGDRHRLAPNITARVLPSIHACTWILTDAPCGQPEHGHTGLTQDERMQQQGLGQRIGATIAGHPDGQEILRHIRESAGSAHDGGALAYLIETPAGRIYWGDTSGCWTGVLAQARADVAILAASGRANVDGEPVQGSMAQFIAMQAATLGAHTVILGHHDNWMPPVTVQNFDVDAVRRELASSAPSATLLELRYLDPLPLLG
jgi:L-ascorbate metabolism protein UlaG (beta-lactamase superfamily)